MGNLGKQYKFVTKTEYDQFTHSLFLQGHKQLEHKYLVPYNV